MKVSTGEKVFYAVNYTVLFFIAMSCLLPVVHVAAVSLSGLHAVSSGKVVLWPIEWTMDAYQKLFANSKVMITIKNSIVITVVGTVLNMLFTILAAYPLSRPYFYFRKTFTLTIVFTMLFSAGLIPNYFIVKSLGLIDTYWALWLPGLVSAWNMLVLRTYFLTIPSELEDAARIDGCGEWRLILRIVLPLSMPVLAALSLFYGVGHWNAFFHVLIYINSSDRYNLSVFVQNMIASQRLLQEMSSGSIDSITEITPESIKSSAIMVMVIPMMVVYPFLQKYFVKGMLIGSVKG
ncbi:carbohydrate ABC transporter permease [Paenibacillus sp. N3.4]|uniref:carbohydrate ABC transporter permease n=1 Tax=Paenibacillus sp. N3.4 TaxID=2603222 RepID=UPI0011C7B501|nr:carbohydrate ABC transporter permease [Paenibacillus sp. N3.4]TXK84464.1 carbohydrate ABC transporter permease [Paenibacillus sp. N3.4]